MADKAALVVFADTETHADMARVVNALQTAQEFKETGGQARVIFDGAGTKWVAELSNPEHRLHRLFESNRDAIAGPCSFCSNAFGVKEQVQAAGIALLADCKSHPSLKAEVAAGYEVHHGLGRSCNRCW